MKLQPGDHVAQKDLTDEQYHAIAKKFMEAGAKAGEYGGRYQHSFKHFGWSLDTNGLHHTDADPSHSYHIKGKTLTPSQILEDDNGWFERGELPPVGTKCEHIKHEKEVFIVAHHHFCKGMAIWCDRAESGQLCYGSSYDFRPIKSDRDKFVDAAVAAVCNAKLGLFDGNAMFFGALYDAGFKLPEGESDAKL